MPATCFIALICAFPPTRETEIPTLIAGPHAGVKQIALQKDLAVGDRDDVGRNVGRDVACLSFNDRQRGQRSAAPSSLIFAARSSKREWR